MENTIDKIYHHLAFSAFWLLVVALIVISFMRLNQWKQEQIQTCLDRGYTYERCILSN